MWEAEGWRREIDAYGGGWKMKRLTKKRANSWHYLLRFIELHQIANKCVGRSHEAVRVRCNFMWNSIWFTRTAGTLDPFHFHLIRFVQVSQANCEFFSSHWKYQFLITKNKKQKQFNSEHKPEYIERWSPPAHARQNFKWFQKRYWNDAIIEKTNVLSNLPILFDLIFSNLHFSCLQAVVWTVKQYKMDARWHWARIHVWNAHVRIDGWHVWRKRVRYYNVRWRSKFNCRANAARNAVKSAQSNRFPADAFWVKDFTMMASDTVPISARHVPVWTVHRFVDAKRVPYSNVHQHIKNLHPANAVRIAERMWSPKPVRPVHMREKPIK